MPGEPIEDALATVTVIAWEGIPAVVEARDATGTVTHALSDRFQALIDSVAMLRGAQDSDAYLEAWRRGEDEERPGSAREAAADVAGELEERFPEFAARAFRPG